MNAFEKYYIIKLKKHEIEIKFFHRKRKDIVETKQGISSKEANIDSILNT